MTSSSDTDRWTVNRNMKKAIFLFLIGLLVSYCEKENQIVRGKITDSSECKTIKLDDYKNGIPDSLSCIYYFYEESTEKLLMKHINAGFNCCPVKLYCVVNMSVDTIIINEYEESAMCNCNCLYDLEIEITGVSPMQYQVKFIEPYSSQQDKIMFTMDLSNHPESSFCAIRKQYPWGMGH